MPRYSTDFPGWLNLESGAAHLAEMGPVRRPLLDDEVIADVGTTGLEPKVGEDGEDAAERGPDRLAADVDVAGRVVLEHRVLRMHAHDGVYVVVRPRLVVAVDELL